MKSSIPIFLLICVALAEERKLSKRSLVSRFTSNPLILKFFGGNFHSDEIFHTGNRFLTDISEEEDCSNEEPQVVRFVIRPNTKDPQIFKETHKEPIQVQQHHVEIPIFKSLPFFERKSNFFKVLEETKDPILKPLPFFERKSNFATHQQPILSSNQDQVIYIFKSLPHFTPPVLFREPAQKVLVEDRSQKNGQVYFFGSLPHFEAKHKFTETPAIPFIDTRFGDDAEKSSVESLTVKKFEDFGKSALEIVPQNQKRRKLVRIVKKKIPVRYTYTDLQDFEFGRRLQPKDAVSSVANLPLGETTATFANPLNSYGELHS